jgi:predicted adenine nucleotide alpha hydrolase (AANH) superfamily ATPase
MPQKILLHTCCGPCAVQCVEQLRGEGLEPVLFWYNPNIHPFTEYQRRKDALTQYVDLSDAALHLEDIYGLRTFIAGVFPALDQRCAFCYRIRLEAAARYGADHGYARFSTTLLISPYQNHALIREIAETAAKQYQIEFLYRDFRPWFRKGQQIAREMGLYMQKYCGCVFSEEERYRKTVDKSEALALQ